MCREKGLQKNKSPCKVDIWDLGKVCRGTDSWEKDKESERSFR